MANEFIAARIHPWQAFRLHKYAEMQGQNEGAVLMDALKTFFSIQKIPAELTKKWLDEYRASHRESPDEMD